MPTDSGGGAAPSGGGNGHYEYDETTGRVIWVEDTPTIDTGNPQPGDPNYFAWSNPYGPPSSTGRSPQGWNQTVNQGANSGNAPTSSTGKDPYNWNYQANQGPNAGSPTPSGGGASPAPSGGGSPGGGGGPVAPPVTDWMDKFGGKAMIQKYVRWPGETLKAYYARVGGNPMQSLLQNHVNSEGFYPGMEMRTLLLDALNLTNDYDSATMDEADAMREFGGKDYIQLFVRQPGEALKNYYERLGGDPVKTLMNKYTEMKGYAPGSEQRQQAIQALGLYGIIDPETLEERFSMPDSDYLGNVMKSGSSTAGLTRNKLGGVRTMHGNDWWNMSRALKTWAPTQQANAPKAPTTTPVP